MKKNIYSISALMLVVLICITACSKEIDNWSYPTSVISGQFLYKGQPLQLMGTASDVTGTNMLQLNQVGPEKWDVGYIKMFGKEDGTYTINTFDGDYYLVITPGKGPWVTNKDTLRFSLQGTKTNVNFEVTPYFWLSNYANEVSDSTYKATFNLEKNVSTAVLEKVVIYLGVTSIVDNTSKVYEKAFTNLSVGNNSIFLDLKTLSASQKATLSKTGFIYARIGVKTVGIADLLYSKTLKLQL